MKKDKLNSISIVTPVFNRAKDIENIKYNLNILEQELKDYEFILVDDCSSDNTPEAIQLFLDQLDNSVLKKIQFIVNPDNLGATGAKNAGSKFASKEWIMFLDSDNRLRENFLLNQNFTHYEENVGAVFFNCNDYSYQEQKKLNNYGEYFMNFSDYVRKFLEYERLPVIRRSVFEKIGRYSESASGFEGLTYLYLTQRNYKICISNKIAQHYETESIDRLSTRKNKIKQAERMLKGYQELLKNFSLQFFTKAPIVFIILYLRYAGYKTIISITAAKKTTKSRIYSYFLNFSLSFIAKFISEGNAPRLIKRYNDEDSRFKFGDNWTNFLQTLEDKEVALNKINIAEDSLKEMLNVHDLKGKSFLDIGSGSGLFSLAARKLGAKVYSFDFDAQSFECTKELKARYFPHDDDWIIDKGSVLDKDYLIKLGQFDVVYSWGVLHHTGEMWLALKNVIANCKKNGKLFIAIYNDQSLISYYWKFIKQTYNNYKYFRPIIVLFHIFYPYLPVIFVRFVTQRKYPRGMNAWYDLIDWLGGWPFEVARPKKIIKYYESNNFTLEKCKTVGSRQGCNEYVFKY